MTPASSARTASNCNPGWSCELDVAEGHLTLGAQHMTLGPMTTDAIKAAIPHREPMLLVDEIVQQTTDTIICRKTFREDEFFFQGHYPAFPLVPGVILCECAMQAGAILLSELIGQADGVPVATRLNNVKFTQMVRPDETIEIEVKLTDQLSRAYFLTARVSHGTKLAARMDFACAAATLT